MKKTPTHVVFSTKKVAKKSTGSREQEVAPTPAPSTQQQQQPPPPPPSRPGEGNVARRQELVVEITEEIAPEPMRHQGSTGSRTSSDGGNSSSSGRSHRHRSSVSSKKGTRAGEHSVKRLRPSPALLQSDRVTVAQCVKSMVEKKTDATLLVDQNGLLTGILTDRDIAFKVVALGRDPKMTRVDEVMTPNPHCVASNASAIDALKKMVSGQFRHLPVADNDKVVGILDIAKCLYEAITKVEQEYKSHSKNLEEAIKKMQRHLPGGAREGLFEKLRKKLFLPTLSAILLERSPVPVLHPDASALDAASLMLSVKTSAVIVCDNDGKMQGIFTSKDLMRRVVALNLDPVSCALSSVMTVNPFLARLNTTILETLHTMHNGKFLHVPVFDDDENLVGLVDVLQATCAIVQEMGTLQFSKNEGVQPLLNELRQSFIANNDVPDGDEADDEPDPVEKLEQDVERSWSERRSRDNSVSEFEPDANDPTSPEHSEDKRPDVFVFKLADWNGANHRFTSSAESLKELLKDVQNRLGDYTIRKLHYVDDDAEHVLLFTDADLKDAVKRARMWGNKFIRLTVLHRASRHGRRSLPRADHQNDTVIGMVYYAAAAAAIAGASFFLSRRR